MRLGSRKYFFLFLTLFFLILFIVSCNPFAPGLDSSNESSPVLSDQKTTDGVFQNFKYSYTFRDTTIYGQLLDGNFTFFYVDYDNGGIPVSWGRDEEMRTAQGLFQNAQRLDLIWNETVSTSANPENTETTINRRFHLTVIFSPSEIIYVDGNVIFQMKRQQSDDPWKIVLWEDGAY
jgi:hypothetical protein